MAIIAEIAALSYIEAFMGEFLARYLDGQHVAVWDELVALGPRIRQDRYHEDAAAVAAETMFRARQNIEMLIERLDRMGYYFLSQNVSDVGRRAARSRLQEIRHRVLNTASGEIDWVAFPKSHEVREAVEQSAEKSRAAALRFARKAVAGKPAPLKNRSVLCRPNLTFAPKGEGMA